MRNRPFPLLWLFLAIFLPAETSAASSAAGQETLIGIVGKDFVMLGADSSVSHSIALQSSVVDKIHILADPFPHFPTKLRKHDAQQTILAAAAGDNADTTRMISLLQSQLAIREYESSIGSDVEYVCIGKNSKDTQEEKDDSSLDDTLSVEAVARLARAQISSSLRTRNPFQTCLLVAGMQYHDTDTNNEHDDIMTPYATQLQQQVQRASRNFQDPSSRNKEAKRDDSKLAATLKDNETNDSLLKPRLYWLDMYGSLQKLQYGAHGMGADFVLSILDQGYRESMTRQDALDLIKECFAQLKQRYIINSPLEPHIKFVDAYGCHVMK